MAQAEAPAVSIIMPCHNAAPFIGIAIESVQAQTYPGWELIAVDDGSNDGSADIIKTYASTDERIVFVQNKKPSGSPAPVRNQALKKARGRYIAFLDADDVWEPNKLTVQLAALKRSGAALCCSQYRVIDGKGIQIGSVLPLWPRYGLFGLLRSNAVGTLTAIYDSKIVKITSFPNLKRCEDWALWLEIVKQSGAAVCVRKRLAQYRVHGNNISKDKVSMARIRWRFYRDHLGLNKPVSAFFFVSFAINGIFKTITGRYRRWLKIA